MKCNMKLAFKLCLLLLGFGTKAQNQCTVPISLTINGEPTSGTTVNAIAGTSNGCDVPKMAPEVNYTVLGNGNFMSAHTCHAATTFSTSMDIASDICGPECLDKSFQYSLCDYANGAGVTWQSDEDKPYTISVFGRESASTGTFEISVFDWIPPINNWCDTAIQLDINGDETMGTSYNATKGRSDVCGGVTKLSNEVYYHVIGTGATLTVTTCSDMTSFETSLAIFMETCNNLCIDGSSTDPNCDSSNGASITWDSTAGTVYEIDVFARQPNDAGYFAIRVFENIAPTVSPSSQNPTPGPTSPPTLPPTPAPTLAPMAAPTNSPSTRPSRAPTVAPTAKPTNAQTRTKTIPQFDGFRPVSHGSPVASLSTIACVVGFGFFVMLQ